jgi:hypothetical protein
MPKNGADQKLRPDRMPYPPRAPIGLRGTPENCRSPAVFALLLTERLSTQTHRLIQTGEKKTESSLYLPIAKAPRVTERVNLPLRHEFRFISVNLQPGRLPRPIIESIGVGIDTGCRPSDG